MESNSTYPVFLVDGNEIKVDHALMPTNYNDFYVRYKEVDNRVVQVYASTARKNDSEEMKKQFLGLFENQVTQTKTELEASKQCWADARDKVIYSTNYNDLIDVITQFTDIDIQRRQSDLIRKFNLLKQDDKNKILCGSVRLEKQQFIQICLNNGAKIPEAADEEMMRTGESLLHIAVNNQSQSLVQLLLNQTLPVALFQQSNNNGKTAEALASDLGLTQIERLIQSAAKDAQNRYERKKFADILASYPTTLMSADDFALLRNSRAININQTDRNNDTLLHKAVRNNDTRLILELTHCRRINPFILNSQNQTADQLAIAASLPDCNSLKEKMFFAAVSQGDITQVRILINGGANIHYQDQQGQNAFHILRNNRENMTPGARRDIANFLIQHHVDPFVETREGYLCINLKNPIDYHLFQPHLMVIIVRKFSQSQVLPDEVIEQIIGRCPSERAPGYQIIHAYRNTTTGDTLLHEIIRSPLSDNDALTMAKKLDLIVLRKVKNNQRQDAEVLARQCNRTNFLAFFNECNDYKVKKLLFEGTIYHNQQYILDALELGADINASLPGTFCGNYLIHHFVGSITHNASSKDNVNKTLEFCSFLLAQGADPCLRNQEGKTTIELVEALYNEEKKFRFSNYFLTSQYHANRLHLFSGMLSLLKRDPNNMPQQYSSFLVS